ncbi:hypothetical protein BDW59DRAFT_29414 [Aspergillus cavernicola]|uniref:Uncharacterized protein n=1 Tax=Aspergillus cavernicola TaxID=176166 RepID=A0ABR4IQJ4_9EURO
MGIAGYGQFLMMFIMWLCSPGPARMIIPAPMVLVYIRVKVITAKYHITQGLSRGYFPNDFHDQMISCLLRSTLTLALLSLQQFASG